MSSTALVRKVRLLEVPVDHAGIVGTRFDEEAGECVPDPAAASGLARVVEVIVEAGD